MNPTGLFIAAVAAALGYTIGHHKKKALPQATPQNNALPTFVNGSPVGLPKYNGTKAPNRPDQVYAGRMRGPDSVTSGAPQYTAAFGPNENLPANDAESF